MTVIRVFLPSLVLSSTFTRTSWFLSAFLKYLLLFGKTSSLLRILEDRIKRGEISELFGGSRVFHTQVLAIFTIFFKIVAIPF